MYNHGLDFWIASLILVTSVVWKQDGIYHLSVLTNTLTQRLFISLKVVDQLFFTHKFENAEVAFRVLKLTQNSQHSTSLSLYLNYLGQVYTNVSVRQKWLNWTDKEWVYLNHSASHILVSSK